MSMDGDSASRSANDAQASAWRSDVVRNAIVFMAVVVAGFVIKYLQ